MQLLDLSMGKWKIEMFRLAEGVSLENADGTLVFLKDNGDAAVLNQIGMVIVGGLIGGSVESCVAQIVCDYDISKDDAKTDVMNFIELLHNLRLIEVFY